MCDAIRAVGTEILQEPGWYRAARHGRLLAIEMHSELVSVSHWHTWSILLNTFSHWDPRIAVHIVWQRYIGASANLLLGSGTSWS
jgi:hypothetical protein